jgi:hypothetical protein
MNTALKSFEMSTRTVTNKFRALVAARVAAAKALRAPAPPTEEDIQAKIDAALVKEARRAVWETKKTERKEREKLKSKRRG